MSNSKVNIIESKLNFLQDKKKGSNWNITWIQGEFLSELISIKKPEFVLEIGTSDGFSTLWIAKNLDESSKIFTIEVNEERFNCAKDNFSKCDLSNIVSLNGEFFEVVDKYKFENKFDFVFIDAAHQFYKEIIDKLIEKEMILDNCMIVADNIITHSYMGEFIKYVEDKFDFCEIIDIGGGFLVASNFKK